ncbi:hypothetical protein CPT_Moabite_266 [Serratia phage Moabite]|uniref:Uncharacterized protein n=1 Tax=Serratia phage Moabite TaxID=2587814 RepID=A0A4Y5TPL8_9CAUD|nr:hypothetical protein HWC48_gp150 [Serratia phage Moabite]QDB71296.1 hypothetical protein CPT_Moabite_266 [Serratia phage Moabite]UGO54149.1 hypothetical protein HAYMO_167 [Serratia phage vB_SmaM_Haymo]
MKPSSKSIIISWVVAIMYILYIVALMVSPLHWLPWIIAVRVIPFIGIWLYDRYKGNKAHGFFSYVLMPQGILSIAILNFKQDVKYVFGK